MKFKYKRRSTTKTLPRISSHFFRFEDLVPLLHQIYKLVQVELCYKIQSSQTAGRSETIPKIVGPVFISHPAGRAETIPKIVGPVVIFFHLAKRKGSRAVRISHPASIRGSRRVHVRHPASRRGSRAVHILQKVIHLAINSEKKTRATLMAMLIVIPL